MFLRCEYLSAANETEMTNSFHVGRSRASKWYQHFPSATLAHRHTSHIKVKVAGLLYNGLSHCVFCKTLFKTKQNTLWSGKHWIICKKMSFLFYIPLQGAHCSSKYLLVPQNTDVSDSCHKSNMLMSKTLKKSRKLQAWINMVGLAQIIVLQNC